MTYMVHPKKHCKYKKLSGIRRVDIDKLVEEIQKRCDSEENCSVASL